jgi:hypothetical protein
MFQCLTSKIYENSKSGGERQRGFCRSQESLSQFYNGRLCQFPMLLQTADYAAFSTSGVQVMRDGGCWHAVG